MIFISLQMQLNAWNENTQESEISDRLAMAGTFVMQFSSILLFYGISQSIKQAVSTEHHGSTFDDGLSNNGSLFIHSPDHSPLPTQDRNYSLLDR